MSEPDDVLGTLLAEHADLERQLADPAVHADQPLARKLSRRYAELGPVAKAIRELEATKQRPGGRARTGRRGPDVRRRGRRTASSGCPSSTTG